MFFIVFLCYKNFLYSIPNLFFYGLIEVQYIYQFYKEKIKIRRVNVDVGIRCFFKLIFQFLNWGLGFLGQSFSN
jgi:hypothetical protein